MNTKNMSRSARKVWKRYQRKIVPKIKAGKIDAMGILRTMPFGKAP